MRKLLFSVLMISLLLLTACGSAGEETKIEEFRTALSESESVSFCAELHTDDGDTVGDYSLRCSRSGEETVLELVSPALLSGVTARITGEEAQLEYDGLSFGAGSIGGDISPMEVPSVLLEGMDGGIPSEICRESVEGQHAVAYSVDRGSGLVLRFYLEETTLQPIYGTVSLNGFQMAECHITDWRME